MPKYNEHQVKHVKVSDIDEGHRFRVDYGDLNELKASISRHGVLQSILIAPHPLSPAPKPYILVAGGRRFRAASELHLEQVPATIVPADISELHIRILEIEENIRRLDLDWRERARLIKEVHLLRTQTRRDPRGKSIRDTARLLGMSSTTVHYDLIIADHLHIDEVASCATRQDAMKLIAKLKEETVERMIASKLSESEQSSPDESSNQVESKPDMTAKDWYHVGDFFTSHNSLTEPFDMAEIDPPYGIEYDKTSAGDTRHYHEVSKSDYSKFLTKLIKATKKHLRPKSWILIWCAFENLNLVQSKLAAAGFEPSPAPIIWHKGARGNTKAPDRRLALTVECAVYARLGDITLTRYGRSNVFEYASIHPDDKIHPTEKPAPLLIDILNTFCMPGSNILVPFLGSGVTLYAAMQSRMKATGFDLSEEYKNAFITKLMRGWK